MQIKKALEGATERSLLLIDEFGKGTKPNDGIAIFSGLIQYLLSMETCPRTIAITHFQEIYQYRLVQLDIPKLKWCTMDLIEDQKIVFLYKVVAGRSQSSLGIYCAKKAGFSDEILHRAEELVEQYSAKVQPIALRYARLDPKLEEAATQLITAINENGQADDILKLAESILGSQ